MYLSHYNLKEKPFQISTDPKFIWLGENHKEALAALEYGVLDNKGFLLLTGDIGTGKTTLINALLERLSKKTIIANISDPILEKLEFLNFIANEFNIDMNFSSKVDFLIHFRLFLNDCYSKNKKVLLIIDEAHRLDQEFLEQIRLLSNIERQDTKLLNIFFVGQNEFLDIISDPKNRALKQRITINYHIDPLKKAEIKEYIHCRLRIAGHKGNTFSTGAINEIFSFSKGYPRLINIICDHALLTGYVKDTKTIDEEIIKECANELILPSERPTERIDYFKNEQKTLEESMYEAVGGPIVKSPRRKTRAIVLSALLVSLLGFLYYLGTFDYYIDKIIKFPIQSPISQAKLVLASTDVPQIKVARQNVNPVFQDSGKSPKALLPLTDPTSENYVASMQGEKDILEPPKAHKIQNQNSVEVHDQEDQLYKMHKPQQAPELASIPTQKILINFGYDSNDLSDEDFKTLVRIAKLIIQNPVAEIIVKGYTDSQGSDSYNRVLSKFRANLVKGFFVGQGISPSRIKTFGMGQKNPAASNMTSEGRKLNRRVEIDFNITKQ